MFRPRNLCCLRISRMHKAHAQLWEEADQEQFADHPLQIHSYPIHPQELTHDRQPSQHSYRLNSISQSRPGTAKRSSVSQSRPGTAKSSPPIDTLAKPRRLSSAHSHYRRLEDETHTPNDQLKSPTSATPLASFLKSHTSDGDTAQGSGDNSVSLSKQAESQDSSNPPRPPGLYVDTTIAVPQESPLSEYHCARLH